MEEDPLNINKSVSNVEATPTTIDASPQPKPDIFSFLGFNHLPLPDLTQQTLIDVNSQPLKSVIGVPIPPNPQNVTLDKPAENEQGELDPNSPIITEFYERFAVGKTFDSLQDIRSSAFEYGRKYNIAITTSKSDKTKVYLICKHGGQYRQNANRKRAEALALKRTIKTVKPRMRKSQKSGCSCQIYARCTKGNLWSIRKSIAQHNHPISQDPRTYAMYRSLNSEHLSTVHQLLKENANINTILKNLSDRGVSNIVPKDIENIQQDLKRREALSKAKPELT